MRLKEILVTLGVGIPLIAAVLTYTAWGNQDPADTDSGHGGGQPGQGGPHQHHAGGSGGGHHQGSGGPGFGGGPSGPVPILAQAAKRADIPVYLDGLGTIKALNTVTVRSQVDGQLVKILFKEGQDVQHGYQLAQIDPRTYQAQLDQANAKLAQDQALLANAKLDLDRYNKLVLTNAGTKQQADTQRSLVAQYEAATRLDQAAIDNASVILGYTKITAPIDGRTGIRQVDEGNLIHASDATGIVVITQLKPISMVFNLPQQELGEVNDAFAQGPLTVQALASDGETVIDTGKLAVIDNQVDQTTGTVRMKADFPNATLKLWPGQFVNVRLLVQTLKQVVMVPTSAVQRGPDGTFVYVVKPDSTVAMRPVTVSQQDDREAVIASGLNPDEQVVTTGFTKLSDGAKVNVASDQSAAGAAPAIEHKDAGIRPPSEMGGGGAGGGGHGGHHHHSDSSASNAP